MQYYIDSKGNTEEKGIIMASEIKVECNMFDREILCKAMSAIEAAQYLRSIASAIETGIFDGSNVFINIDK